jgi:hypothetical protein
LGAAESNFANRRVLSGGAPTAFSSSLLASRELGEPLHAGQYGQAITASNVGATSSGRQR